MEGYTSRISRRKTTEECFYALVSTRNASIRRYTRLLQETAPSDQHMASIVRQFDDLRDEWWQGWKSTIPPTPAIDVITVRVAHHGPLRIGQDGRGFRAFAPVVARVIGQMRKLVAEIQQSNQATSIGIAARISRDLDEVECAMADDRLTSGHHRSSELSAS